MEQRLVETLLSQIKPSLREGVFSEHAQTCTLPSQQCEQCQAEINNFWAQWVAEGERLDAARKRWTWREKSYDWYLMKNSFIRQKIWIWRGCPGPRPPAYDNNILDVIFGLQRLAVGICRGWCKTAHFDHNLWNWVYKTEAEAERRKRTAATI